MHFGVVLKATSYHLPHCALTPHENGKSKDLTEVTDVPYRLLLLDYGLTGQFSKARCSSCPPLPNEQRYYET